MTDFISNYLTSGPKAGSHLAPDGERLIPDFLKNVPIFLAKDSTVPMPSICNQIFSDVFVAACCNQKLLNKSIY